MLTASVIAIIVLGILLWDQNERAKSAIAALDRADEALGHALKQVLVESEQRDVRLRAAIRVQENLIAMLWYNEFGMEPADDGSHVPSGRLVEVNGFRPRLKVSDPLFVSDELKFTTR